MPQVEKMCIDKGLTDETEIIRFLQNGTLVGLLPVPHPRTSQLALSTGIEVAFNDLITSRPPKDIEVGSMTTIRRSGTGTS